LLWYITPFFRAVLYGSQFNIIMSSFLIIWLVTAFIINPKWILKSNYHLIIVTVFLLIFIFTAILDIYGNHRVYLNVGISFWFSLYVYHFYKSTNLIKE